MNSKIIKIRFKDKNGLDVFKEYTAPGEVVSMSEVELINHKETDETLDLLKGTK